MSVPCFQMKQKLKWILVLLSGAFSCCTSVRPCPADTASIMLPQVEERSSGICKIYFPPGRYSPDFQSSQGIYYSSEKRLTLGGLTNFGINRPMRGGIFIPFSSDTDKRHAFWLDHQESSRGLLGIAGSSNTRLRRFNPPLNYHLVR